MTISQTQVWATDSVAPSQQFALWKEAVCDAFLQLDVQSPSADRFRGSIETRHAGQLRISLVDAQQQRVERHRADGARLDKECFYLNFQMAGQGLISQRGDDSMVSPGQWYVLDSTEPFRLDYGDSFRSLNVEIPMKLLGSGVGLARGAIGRRFGVSVSEPRRTQGAEGGLAAYLGAQAQVIARHAQALGEQRLCRITTEFIDTFLEAIAPATSALTTGHSRDVKRRQVERFISDHLADPQLSPLTIAAACHLSLRSLHGLFGRQQPSLMEFIRERRLELARSRLQSRIFRDQGIAALAYSCGFSDLSHFCRAYKRHFGVTPSNDRGSV